MGPLLTQRFTVGETYKMKVVMDESMVERFADFSGDRNPIHVDAEEARAYGYARQVAHGGILVSLISKAIGMEIPGPGAVWMSQQIDWLQAIFVGDEIELIITIESISSGAKILSLDTIAVNQKGTLVMKGKSKVKVSERLQSTSAAVTPAAQRVALVTGASGGMGAAIARRLAADGMAVAVHYYKSRNDAEGLVQEIKASEGQAEAFAGNLEDPKTAEGLVQEVISTFGQLDIVIHGASPHVKKAGLETLSYVDFEPFLNVYLKSAISILSAVLPGMKERKFGRFIFLGTSFISGIPPAGIAPYIVAKEGLWGLVKSMATEFGPFGVTSNLISPGMTVTDFTADIPARLKEIEALKSPARRLATVEDTAEAVAFLVSQGAGYINGVNLPLTGGPV